MTDIRSSDEYSDTTIIPAVSDTTNKIINEALYTINLYHCSFVRLKVCRAVSCWIFLTLFCAGFRPRLLTRK